MQARFGLRHTGIIRHVCCSIFDPRLTNNDVVFEGSCDCHLVPNPGWPDVVPCDGWRISDSCVHTACGSTDILVAATVSLVVLPFRPQIGNSPQSSLDYQSMLESFIAPSHQLDFKLYVPFALASLLPNMEARLAGSQFGVRADPICIQTERCDLMTVVSDNRNPWQFVIVNRSETRVREEEKEESLGNKEFVGKIREKHMGGGGQSDHLYRRQQTSFPGLLAIRTNRLKVLLHENVHARQHCAGGSDLSSFIVPPTASDCR